MLHNPAVSQRLKQLVHAALARKGWSQNQLAYRLGVSTAAPSAWWKTGEVSRENMRALSEELEIPLTDLYAAIDDSGTSPVTGEDPILQAFAKFIVRLPEEDRATVTSLLEAVSKRMPSQFVLATVSTSRQDDPVSSTTSSRGKTHGADSKGASGRHSKRRVPRVRDS